MRADRTLFAVVRRRILLADHFRVRPGSRCGYADLTDLDMIVTDAGISDQAMAAVSAAGVDITIARKAA